MSGSGTGANLPVRIQVEGAPQAEAAFNRVGQAGQAAMQNVQRSAQQAGEGTRNFGNVIGQAGFQVQDFAGQVAAGQSALVALAQQGSQFLGVFGTGGAIAGAALTVGILALQFLSASAAAEQAAKVAEEGFRNTGRVAGDLRDVLRQLNELYLTNEQRARASAEATRANLTQQLRRQQDVASQMLEGSAMELPEARQQAERAERALARLEEARRRSGVVVQEGDVEAARARAFSARARVQGLEADIGRQSRTLGTIAEALRQAEQPLPDSNGGGGGGGARPAPEVRGDAADTLQNLRAEAEARRDAARALDDYSQRQNLANAGLERASGLLQAYERDQQALSEALRVGIITEEQFGAAVAESSERLAEQMEALERRTEDSSRGARELGFAFQSAFEDAILKGKDLGDVLQGLAQDLARIALRQTVTQPLANALGIALGNLFGPSGGGGLNPLPSTGGVSANPFGFADGGIMTSRGPLPLNRYASGGIANSPQLALFGEGRGPEAYVPLPDGRSIPVTMNGGGGGIVVNLAVDARGAGPREIDILRAQIPGLVRQGALLAVNEAAQRGGPFSRNLRGGR